MTGETERLDGGSVQVPLFPPHILIQADLESSPSLRGESQATNPPERWSVPSSVLHLASLCWQTNHVDDRYEIYMCVCVCVCVRLVHTWGKYVFPKLAPSHPCFLHPT